jgi:hypothetical protein
MPQLAFVTLFLGLVSGVQPVAVSLVGDAAVIELRLDDRTVATLHAPPWRADVDFGSELVPHRLEARALDAHGAEIARATQRLNLPRPPAEVELQLERDPAGAPRAARLLWQNVTGESPLATAVHLDGNPLPIVAGRVELPAVDPTLPHVLSAELRFENGIVARRDAAFGGDLGTELRTEITAAIVIAPPRARADALPAGALLAGGAPAHVVAQELGPAHLLVVRTPAVVAPLAQLASHEGLAGTSQVGPSFPSLRGGHDLSLASEESLRFLWPQASGRRLASAPLKLFYSSREFGGGDGGLFWLLTHVLEPASFTGEAQLADAVAVAGLQAAAGNARRAVLVMLGDDRPDGSQYDAAHVARYLRAVGVPLHVWRLVKRTRSASPGDWGEGEPFTSQTALFAAARRLQEGLARQRVVWVDGSYAPGEFSLSAAARAAGYRLAGEDGG